MGRASTPPLPEPDQASESSPHRRPPSRCVLRSQQGSIQHVDSSRNLGQRHRITNPEFHELKAAIFGHPSPICKQHLGAQINKANQSKTADLYRDNIKTAAGVPGGSFMHFHQAMVNVVANDLRNGHIIYKTGIDAFSGAVSGNMETKND
jgi:hypothetical protein